MQLQTMRKDGNCLRKQDVSSSFYRKWLCTNVILLKIKFHWIIIISIDFFLGSCDVWVNTLVPVFNTSPKQCIGSNPWTAVTTCLCSHVGTIWTGQTQGKGTHSCPRHPGRLCSRSRRTQSQRAVREGRWWEKQWALLFRWSTGESVRTHSH